jgi:hypothetical protein
VGAGWPPEDGGDAGLGLVEVLGPLGGVGLAGGVGLVVGVGAVMVQLWLGGPGSTLPAESVARTLKLCAPWARELKDSGETQAVHAPPSSRQAKLEPGFDEVKLKLALVAVLDAAGPAVIDVVGGVASTLKLLGLL